MVSRAWCDMKYWTKSWNPIVGCRRASRGCESCWAEGMARRMACNPNQKIAGRFSQLLDKHGRWNGATCFDEAKLTEPGKWRKPQIVAVCWMGDLFINGDEADFERITMVFNAMEKHNAHTYLLLTKRPENLWEFIDWKQAQLSGWEPAPNIWLGTSVEDQRTADVRLPELLTCPGNLWVSAEPLIEQVTLRYIHHEGLIEIDALAGKCGVYRPLERPFWSSRSVLRSKSSGHGRTVPRPTVSMGASMPTSIPFSTSGE